MDHDRRTSVSGGNSGGGSLAIRSKGPFDLPLSLEGAASFFPIARPPPILRVPIDSGVIEIRQSGAPSGFLHVASSAALPRDRLRRMAKWLVCADLDLRPFYELGRHSPLMLGVINSLIGVKPMRPPTLFEMAIIAITEQQLSLAAAFHIRARLVQSFGTPLGGSWIFPTAERLADASLQTLCTCGLSRRKAEYIKDLSNAVRAGTLDIEALRSASDQRVREALMGRPGFGQWSVDYILSRGLVRPDSLPSGDAGLQRVVGHYFSGQRLTAEELEHALAPFEPYRGLAAYYLAVHWRLKQGARP